MEKMDEDTKFKKRIYFLATRTDLLKVANAMAECYVIKAV
jgi:hypothetical protein